MRLSVLWNFHVVAPRVLYRSRTLSVRELGSVVGRFKIRTVLNLRGSEPERRWFEGEVAALDALQIGRIDISMVDYLIPEADVLDRLLDALRFADRPLLIHCKHGADRTGLACALFSLVVLGQPPHIAVRQLSMRYGHIPWIDRKSFAMDETFWRTVRSRSITRQTI